MNGCGCDETRERLEELIRGELCASDSAPIRAHLDACPDCRDEQQVCERLTVAVRRACEGEAPPTLREAILHSLRDLGAPQSDAQLDSAS